VSIEGTERVVRGWAFADAAGSQFDSSAGTKLCDSQQVVSGADQVGGESGTFDAPIAVAPEVADRLDPAEDLLDPLARSLTDRVSRPIGGTQVERRRSFCATGGVILSTRQLATNVAVS